MMAHLLVSLLVALAAQTAAPVAFQSPVSAPTYVLGPSDVIGVKVFDEPELSREYSIDTDGTITFPFLNRVPVGGKTIREVEQLLTAGLSEGWVRRPQVSVAITSFRSRNIFVLGEVRVPGKYSIEGQVTLLEVIAKAGSLTTQAGNTIIVLRYKDALTAVNAVDPALPGDPRGVELMRISYEDLREGRMTANILLQDGDSIVVPPADRFYVTGFVRTPGTFTLQVGMTVQQAIAVAGGITERGSNRGIKITRKENGTDVERDAKLTDLVRPNDTIRVRQRLI